MEKHKLEFGTVTGADAWYSNGGAPEVRRDISPVETAPTRLPDNPQLPMPRAARLAGTRSTECAATRSRRPLAPLPSVLLPTVSQDQSGLFLYRLPNELLQQIGRHLLNLPESSSLKAAALASRRLHNVFSPFRDESMKKFKGERNNFIKALRGAFANDNAIGRLFFLLRFEHTELRPYLVHDAIDYINDSARGSREISVALTALLEELPTLVPSSELAPILTRLIPCHNPFHYTQVGVSGL